MPTHLEATFTAAGYAKVIVSFKRGAAAAALDTTAIKSDLEGHFMTPDGDQAAGLGEAESLRRRDLGLEAAAPAPAPKLRVFPRLGLAIGYTDPNGAFAVAADPRVDRVVEAETLSLIRPVLSLSVPPIAQRTWGLERLRIPALWAAGLRGEGVVVGHLDTGIDGTHPTLADAIHEFAEFDLLGDRVPGAPAVDSGDHGTHTAGTIVGRAVAGVAAFGVAPEAKVASGMVIEGGQVIDRILSGMEWVIGTGTRILSLSLGLRGFTPAFQVIVDALRDAGVLPVFAVGNEFANSSRSPGNYANVLSIGAMDEADRVAPFSSSQTFQRPDDPLVPDLVAPGARVFSCVPGGGFDEKSGTSMATPHVAGLAALLVQARPDASVDALEQAILQSCSRPATMLQGRANRGVPDAVQALSILTGEPPVTAIA